MDFGMKQVVESHVQPTISRDLWPSCVYRPRIMCMMDDMIPPDPQQDSDVSDKDDDAWGGNGANDFDKTLFW